eukprot:TRINITY_DN82500_c0_g1_i1.p1 TRINITY_DN82500_c0_g1~~TRINITY_DN82500_c0_g1_i1.p1  ORF type:complete len:319 (+),score=73.14 TRINITY_DN82500_c0_g1_i1:38-958(+)
MSLASEPAAKRLKASPSRTVLVVRHGEGQHQLKKAAAKAARIDSALGPALTEKGIQQGEAAAQRVAEELDAASHGEGALPLVVTSNLLRAVHTALLVAPLGAEVVVHPGLRERMNDTVDEPSELEALRVWVAEAGLAEVQLHLYEEALEEATSLDPLAESQHASYVRSCWHSDCLENASGGLTGKQNKAQLAQRAADFTAWLESQDAEIVVLVGHAVFLGMVTGDKDWLENGEVRSYSLSGGHWQRLSGKCTPAVKAIAPASTWAGSGARIGPAATFARLAAPGAGAPKATMMRPRGSLGRALGQG